jgi:hypothetical protein
MNARMRSLAREVREQHLKDEARRSHESIDKLVAGMIRVKNSVTIEQAREVADETLKGSGHGS